jgi:hypothetical protein
MSDAGAGRTKIYLNNSCCKQAVLEIRALGDNRNLVSYEQQPFETGIYRVK